MGVKKVHPKFSTARKTLILAFPWGADMDTEPLDGITAKVTTVRRNPIVSLNPAIKSGNYLNNILALDEANDANYDECLMITPSNMVSELSRLGLSRKYKNMG